MAFTDGCSLDNPGKAGAGVTFYGVMPGESLRYLNDSSETDFSDFS